MHLFVFPEVRFCVVEGRLNRLSVEQIRVEVVAEHTRVVVIDFVLHVDHDQTLHTELEEDSADALCEPQLTSEWQAFKKTSLMLERSCP